MVSVPRLGARLDEWDDHGVLSIERTHDSVDDEVLWPARSSSGREAITGYLVGFERIAPDGVDIEAPLLRLATEQGAYLALDDVDPLIDMLRRWRGRLEQLQPPPTSSIR